MHVKMVFLGRINILYFLHISFMCMGFLTSHGSYTIGWLHNLYRWISPIIFKKPLFLLLSFSISRSSKNFPFIAILLWMIMGKKNKLVHIWDIVSMYSTVDMIDKFRHNIIFSGTVRERDIIMEPCSKEERAKMDTSGKNGCSLFLRPPPHHLRDKGFDFIYLFRNVVSNID